MDESNSLPETPINNWSGKGPAHRCVAWNKFPSHSESLCLHRSRKLLTYTGRVADCGAIQVSCGCCPNLPHTQWLQATEIYSSSSSGGQKSEIWGAGQGWLCLEAPGGDAVFPPPSGGCLHPWLVATSLHTLPPSSHGHLPYILQVPFCIPLLRTLVITLGAQPHNRESLCISQSFIISAQSVLPGKITFRGSGKRGHDIVSPRAPDLSWGPSGFKV